MPRRGKIAKRDVLEDPIYGSKLVTRLINNVMIDGKKGVARRLFTVRLKSLPKRLARMHSKYSSRQWKT